MIDASETTKKIEAQAAALVTMREAFEARVAKGEIDSLDEARNFLTAWVEAYENMAVTLD